MNWEAANAPKARKEARAYEGDNLSSPAREKRRSTETVEAALSRVSKAYTTSMECIGALNKTNRMLQKESAVSEENVAVLERVSNAARSTLTAILLDPLLVPHCPTLNQTMHDFAETGAPEWTSVKEKRPAPPVLSSAAHKTTIRELAYLSLVNFSDLLLSCCIYGSDRNQASILDRGVVRKVKTLVDKNKCCWVGESEKDTQILVVTALCDASNIDGSDPTLWLKLACAARGLEQIVCENNNTHTILQSKHRRLQRYALERGIQALPPNMPPNRTVLRALEELNSEPEPELYESIVVADTEEQPKITLELPRYSWSMLGRMLIRACREGSDFEVDSKHHGTERKRHSMQFGSPAISLRLSPMLVLPAKVLGRICQFLENRSIWRFEATCKALSVSIIAARVLIEKEKSETVDNERSVEKKTYREKAEEPKGRKTKETNPKTENDSSKNEKVQSHRTSKRLRSQLITSGKIADRESKRKSFDYCFLAATMSCTKAKHREDVKQFEKDGRVSKLLQSQDIPASSEARRTFRNTSSNPKDVNHKEARERLGDSSLSAFVEGRSSRQNSGPMDLLIKYLAHISINVEDVFSSEPGGTMVLASCVLSCKCEE